MIEPTERLLWLVVAAGVVGVCGLAAPAVGDVAPFVLAGVFAVAVADAVLAGAPSGVRVTRHVRERLVEGKAVDIALELQHAESRPILVEVTDTVALLEPAWATHRLLVGPGERASVSAPRRCVRRGEAGLGQIAVRTLGPLGLVRRRHRREGAGDVITVGLDTAAIVRAAERIVRGGDSDGARRKRAIERGRELGSLRDYRRGDDVRLVDWKASARRGSLIVKELVPETRQDVLVVLDTGRQFLGVSAQGRPRLDGAVHTASLLCAAAIEKGDRAGLAVLDDDVRAFVPPREGRAQLARVAEAAQAASALAVEPAYQELAATVELRQKRRALIAIVTDVVDEDQARAVARAIATLRGRHVVMVVALADPDVQAYGHAEPGPLRDAALTLLGHRRRALAALEASGALVVDSTPDRAGADAVDAYLALKAQGRV